VGGGKAANVGGEGKGELAEMDVDRDDGKEDQKRGDGGGAENTGDVAECIVLGNACLIEEVFGAGSAIIDPKGSTIREDRENDGIVGTAPVGIVEATDRIAENEEGTDGGTSPMSHGVNMRYPGEGLMEEDAKVLNDRGGVD
jgi:hypothetical protein